METSKYQEIVNQKHDKYLEQMKSERGKESKRMAAAILRKKDFFVLPFDEESYCEEKDIKKIKAHSDKGDVKFMFKDYPLPVVCEVKRHTDHVPYWTDRVSYPYKNFFIDGKGQYDKKKPSPVLYIIFNEDMTAFASVTVSTTIKDWHVFNANNPLGNFKKDYYAIDVNKVNFFNTKQFFGDEYEKYTQEDLFTS